MQLSFLLVFFLIFLRKLLLQYFIGSHCEKWVTFGKIGHTMKKWVTLGKMGHIWKNGTHCEIFNTFQNVTHFLQFDHFLQCDPFFTL